MMLIIMWHGLNSTEIFQGKKKGSGLGLMIIYLAS